MVFLNPLNTVKTDDRCVNGCSVPVGVLMGVMCRVLTINYLETSL